MQAVANFSKAKEAIIADGRIDETALDQLFREARTHNGGRRGRSPTSCCARSYDLAKMGPTSANDLAAARIVFVRTTEGKERLKPALGPGNLEKTMAAPVTAIIGHDLPSTRTLPKTLPAADATRSWFVGRRSR